MAELVAGFFLDFFVALGLGALIGLEREHRRDEATVIAGVRTFPLFSLTGYMIGVVANETGNAFVTAAGVVVIGAVSLGFLLVRHRLGIHGLTSPMAMVVTFLLGMLIAHGFLQEAVVIGVATTFLLLTKGRLHSFAETLNDAEIMSALQFFTVVLILLPLAANLEGPIDPSVPWLAPGGLVDPFKVLLIVTFVAVISFVSFVAMRTIGARRGFEVSGLLGGLVNSEATAISLAHRAEASRGLVGVAVVGILLATATMFIRNLVILAFAAGSRAVDLLPFVVPVAVVGAAMAAGLALWQRRGAGHEAGNVGRLEVRNPFAVWEATKFALIFAALSAIVTLLQRGFGEFGVYAAAIGGFAYAGAVVASLGVLVATGQVDVRTAGITVGLALLAGAANKAIILRHVDRDIVSRVTAPVLAVVAAGGLALALTLLFAPDGFRLAWP